MPEIDKNSWEMAIKSGNKNPDEWSAVDRLYKPLRNYSKYESINQIQNEEKEIEECTFTPAIINKPPRPNTTLMSRQPSEAVFDSLYENG